MEFDIAFLLRMANVALAVFVISLCFLKLIWNDKERALKMRVLALALLSFSAAWMAYDLRLEDFHARVPLTMFGLLIAAYGLHAMPSETRSQSANKST